MLDEYGKPALDVALIERAANSGVAFGPTVWGAYKTAERIQKSGPINPNDIHVLERLDSRRSNVAAFHDVGSRWLQVPTPVQQVLHSTV